MEKEKLMNEINANIKACKKCRLCQTATNAVPGEGNINSKIIFIGEAPGYYEDVSGRPFVGRAGKLLEGSLNKIGYKREDVWIGNIIKHRPPENREPLPDEISSCSPFLSLQIKTIKPVIIVTLGRYSMNFFYPDGKISRDRGRLIKIGENYVYPIYHPAAALRSTSVLEEFRRDFEKIPQILIEAEELMKGKEYDNQPQNPSVDSDGQLGLGL